MPEAYGGLGGSIVDVAVLMEVLGQGLVLEPYLPTVVPGAGAIALAGGDALKSELLPGVVEGKRLLAFAHGEPQSRYDLTNVETREQFGGPISRFQALQHRVVDMFVAHEMSRSLTYRAAGAVAENTLASTAASAAKLQIGKAGRLIGQEAIQLYGGMGMTDDLAVGHYFKRLTMIGKLFGDVPFHLRRLAQ